MTDTKRLVVTRESGNTESHDIPADASVTGVRLRHGVVVGVDLVVSTSGPLHGGRVNECRRIDLADDADPVASYVFEEAN